MYRNSGSHNPGDHLNRYPLRRQSPNPFPFTSSNREDEKLRCGFLLPSQRKVLSSSNSHSISEYFLCLSLGHICPTQQFTIMYFYLTTQRPHLWDTLNYSPLRPTTSPRNPNPKHPQNQQSDRSQLRSDTLGGLRRFWATMAALVCQNAGNNISRCKIERNLSIFGVEAPWFEFYSFCLAILSLSKFCGPQPSSDFSTYCCCFST